MYHHISTLLLAVAILLPTSTFGWSGDLGDGSLISVDPTTGKVLRYSGTDSQQLWDGTHRLKDGSVVIVRDGIAISGVGETTTQPAETKIKKKRGEDKPPQAVSPCIELIIKVCGFNGACNGSPACSPARQLLHMEEEAAWKGDRSGRIESIDQCRKAQQNSFFTPCGEAFKAKEPTSCKRLVTRVCGTEGECSDGKGCALAKQLLELEREELLLIQDQNIKPETSKQCEETLGKNDFFVPCSTAKSNPDT